MMSSSSGTNFLIPLSLLKKANLGSSEGHELSYRFAKNCVGNKIIINVCGFCLHCSLENVLGVETRLKAFVRNEICFGQKADKKKNC